MFEWKNLVECSENDTLLKLGWCKAEVPVFFLHIGRFRIFHRINIEHLLELPETTIDPSLVQGLHEDVGVGDKFYLQLFPHRMVHLGNIQMTCYENNEHPVLFSFPVEELEKNYEGYRYINQTYYLQWCMDLLHELADGGDEESKVTLLQAKSRLFDDMYFSQVYSEMILPKLDLRLADSVIVFNHSDLNIVNNWISKNEMEIELIDLSKEGLQSYLGEDNFNRNCNFRDCKSLQQVFNLARQTEALQLLESDAVNCPLLEGAY